MKYQPNLELSGDTVEIIGGQGDWIVIRGKGPDGNRATETYVHRESLGQFRQMVAAMLAYLGEAA